MMLLTSPTTTSSIASTGLPSLRVTEMKLPISMVTGAPQVMIAA